MSDLNRRDFLKVLGVTGSATAAAGCQYLDPRVPYENDLPYVVVPDQILPGVSTWFATACNECSAGCGVVARNREGRVVKLEGNTEHPTNKGRLCSRGQAGILATYSPDRFAGPMKGKDALAWDAAQQAVVEALGAAKGSNKQVAWLGQGRTGSLGALITQFVGALNATQVHWEPLGYEALKAAVMATFGVSAVPSYVLDQARTILSFGADFLGTWLSPVAQAQGYANSRDPNVGSGVSRLICVEPRLGNTTAMADLHVAAKAGTEVGVALAIAALLAQKNGYSGPAAALVSGVDIDGCASAAGLSREKLEEIAGWLAEGPSVVFPGGAHTSAAPTDLAVASMILNEVAGNIGHSVVFGPEPNLDGVGSFRDMAQLIGDCAAGKVGVLFIDGLDPVYASPSDLNVKDALSKVDLVVVFANEPNDSLGSNTLVLPPGTTLETWGDNEAVRGRYTLQQPAMLPLKDTRAIGDVLLGVAKAMTLTAPIAETPANMLDTPALLGLLGTRGTGKDAAPEAPAAPTVPERPGFAVGSWREYVAAWWNAVVWPVAGAPGAFAEFWTTALERGGYFNDLTPHGADFVLAALPATAPAALGDTALALFPHLHLHDGRHANRPWAQEVPEPLSTYAWGTWAEIHPDRAAELGLTKEDGVIVETSGGSIEVGWFGSPGIRKDLVAVVMGNGHENAGRYARYGKNPMKLLTSRVDEASGQLTLVSAGVTVKRSGNPNPVFAQAGSMNQDNRGLNHTAYIGDLAGAQGPGSAVRTEEVPFDERLEKAGIFDMYPEPEHPTYRFALSVDLNRCTGCAACQTACYAENNIPVVGPEQSVKGRQMGWIRLSRYFEGEGEHPDVRFQPVMCQQCSHAPCEGVCPVLATYHNLDGLNAMIYNRCVGTRYCANNCPYTARRFNYHTFSWPEPFMLMLNPDVSVRTMGVMEKCNFCVQRLREAKDMYRDQGHTTVPNNVLKHLPACVAACPADAMTFGNLKDPDGDVYKKFQDPRAYTMLHELNTKPGVRYLARITHQEPAIEGATASAAEASSGEQH